jgi:hypothetical protein
MLPVPPEAQWTPRIVASIKSVTSYQKLQSRHSSIERTIDNTIQNGKVANLDNKKLRPSIHMLCRASRLTLLLSDVKFEQLQDINRANAGADAVEHETTDLPFWYVTWI